MLIYISTRGRARRRAAERERGGGVRGGSATVDLSPIPWNACVEKLFPGGKRPSSNLPKSMGGNYPVGIVPGGFVLNADKV